MKPAPPEKEEHVRVVCVQNPHTGHTWFWLYPDGCPESRTIALADVLLRCGACAAQLAEGQES